MTRDADKARERGVRERMCVWVCVCDIGKERDIDSDRWRNRERER